MRCAWARGLCARFCAISREELRRFDDLSAVLRHARFGRLGLGLRERAGLRGQGAQQRELSIELRRA